MKKVRRNESCLTWVRSYHSPKLTRYGMGVLSGPVLCERYLVNHGDPSARFDFGAVWLVGPTENHVFSLGSSR